MLTLEVHATVGIWALDSYVSDMSPDLMFFKGCAFAGLCIWFHEGENEMLVNLALPQLVFF